MVIFCRFMSKGDRQAAEAAAARTARLVAFGTGLTPIQPSEPAKDSQPRDEDASVTAPALSLPAVLLALAICGGIVAGDAWAWQLQGTASPSQIMLWLLLVLLAALGAAAGLALALHQRTGPPQFLRVALAAFLLTSGGLLGAARAISVLGVRGPSEIGLVPGARELLALQLAAMASEAKSQSQAEHWFAAKPSPSAILSIVGTIVARENIGPGNLPGSAGSAEVSPFAADRFASFGRTDFLTARVALESVGSVRCFGQITLAAPAALLPAAGSRIAAVGTWLAPAPEGQLGQRHTDRQNRSRQAIGVLLCAEAGLITTPEGEAAAAWQTPPSVYFAIDRAQTRAASVLDAAVSGVPPSGDGRDAATVQALLAALLLGEYRPEVRGTAEQFARLGLLHALSISGFHIAVLAGVAGFGLRLFGILGRANRFALLLLVVGYVCLLPPGAPIARSVAMVVLATLLLSTLRSADALSALALVASALALFNPVDVFAPGFALTFLATGVLVRFSGPLAIRAGLLATPRLRGALAVGYSPRPLLRALLATTAGLAMFALAIWLVTAPVIAAYAGQLSVLGMLLSIPLAMLLSLVLVAALLGSLLSGVLLVCGFAGWVGFAMAPAGFFSWITLQLANLAEKVPGVSVRLPPLGSDWLSLLWPAFATLAAWLLLERWLGRRAVLSGRAGWRAAIVPLGALASVVWLLMLVLVAEPRNVGDEAGGAVRVRTIAVGSARATLVAAGNRVLLIDPGCPGPGASGPGAMALRRALRAIGTGDVPTLVLTGATVRHAGLTLELLGPLAVREVVVTPFVAGVAEGGPDRPIAEVLRRCRQQGIIVRTMANEEIPGLQPGRDEEAD